MDSRKDEVPPTADPSVATERACTPAEMAEFHVKDAKLRELQRELGMLVASFRIEETRLVNAIVAARDVRDGYVHQVAAGKGIGDDERARWRLVVEASKFVKVGG